MRTASATHDDPPVFSSFAALGSQVEVGVTRSDLLAEVSAHVRAQVELVEQSFSRFRSDSELSDIEQRAGQPTRCSPLFGELLQLACWAAASTDGWFDPTIRDALEAAGYDRDFSAVERNGPGPARSAAPAGRWRAIHYDSATRLVTLPSGLRLDFGGIGKGFAVDLALRTLPALDAGVLVSAGGDLAISGPPPEGGWRCGIAPTPDSPAETTVALWRGALATSGLGRRQWTRAGQAMHHLIDPRTGQPGVSPWRCVSVAASGCLAAEVAAKVGWLRGYAGPAWLHGQGLPGRFQALTGRVVTTERWPAAAPSPIREAAA
jgi:thiamine biosynthesis lipoprotein